MAYKEALTWELFKNNLGEVGSMWGKKNFVSFTQYIPKKKRVLIRNRKKEKKKKGLKFYRNKLFQHGKKCNLKLRHL